MKSLKEIHAEYEAFIQQTEPLRSRNLAELMTEMERRYKIPMMRSEAWEKENKAVIAMYRKISLSRNLD